MRSVKTRLAVFVKFHSTQIVLFSVFLAGAWSAAPDDMKAALFEHWPLLGQYKTELAFLAFLVAFYKTRMNGQFVERKDLPSTDKPEQVEPPKS